MNKLHELAICAIRCPVNWRFAHYGGGGMNKPRKRVGDVLNKESMDMSFFELLKIEVLKVKRSKIFLLLFIAPLLVVLSGVASLHSYFTPEYTNAWAAMFIQSALVYAYYLLPLSMIVVCVMIAGRETTNNGIAKMLALPLSRYALSAAKFCVLLWYLFMDCLLYTSPSPRD